MSRLSAFHSLLFVLLLSSCSGGKESIEEAKHGFHASGSNPAWQVDMNFETGEVRIVAEGDESYDISFTLGTPTFRDEFRRVSYSLPVQEALVEIHIDNRECTEAGSDRKERYSVNLRFLDARTREEKSSFDGCGRYSGLGELTRRWRLTELDGEEIVEIREGERMPTLWFNLQEGTVSGDGSCNYFNGPATLTSDSILIGPLAASKTVCPRISRESLYIDALRTRGHQPALTDESLVLKSDLHEMRFVRK